MVSRIYSAGIVGVEGYEVTVECSAWNRIPLFELVGLPDAAVKEAKERVKNACENVGIPFPSLELTVNLAPADRKKEGAGFDLPILRDPPMRRKDPARSRSLRRFDGRGTLPLGRDPSGERLSLRRPRRA